RSGSGSRWTAASRKPISVTSTQTVTPRGTPTSRPARKVSRRRLSTGPSGAKLPASSPASYGAPLLRVLLGCALLFAAGCRCADPPPPNVILIVLDTVRHDHVGWLGATNDTTPNLDRLAARSDVYTEA